MASTIDKKDGNLVVINFEATKEELDASMQKAYSKNKGKFQVPGFRKGKVPYKLVLQYYGEGVLLEDAITDLANTAYPEAIKEHDLKPVSRPELDVESIDENGVKYNLTVTVKPEVKLGAYEGVEVPYMKREVTDEDIDRSIDALRRRNSSLEEITDRAVEEGDTVTIDYEGFKDGVAFEGGKGENYNLKIGSHSFIPGFEEQIIGHNDGEEFTIEVKFPEEYHSEELKGADATFNVKINAIKSEVMPELDDEFAKDVSEFDTLDELRADIRKKEEERAEKDAKAAFENETVRVVCDNAEVDIPDVMIENEIETMAQDQAMRMSQQGIELGMYLNYIGQTMEEYRESLKPMARVRVKSSLVVEAVAEKINTEITDEDYEEELKVMADSYRMSVEDIKNAIGEDNEMIKDSIRGRKTVEYLASKAVKTEPVPAEEEKAEEAASETEE